MQKNISVLINIFVISFVLNLIWENVQAPLYGYPYSTFLQHFGMCFRATAGDAIFIMILYFIVTWLRNNQSWLLKIKFQDFAIIIFLGFVGSILLEKFALAWYSWHYTSAMPIIPWVNVGVVPVLQMLILPPLTFYITSILLFNHTQE